MDATLGNTLRELLRKDSDVRLALAFGSRARGSASVSSDLDLAISAPGLDLLALSAELSERLGVEVDALDLDSDIPIPLLEALVRDALVLHEGARGAAADWRTRSLLALETDGPWYRRMRDAWLARVAERGL